MASVPGWSGPSFDSYSLSVASKIGIASALRPASLVGGGEPVAAGERVGVVGAELRLAQLQRRLVERDRLGGAAGGPVGVGEAVAAGERVGVVGAELRLVQPQRRLVERDRLGEAACEQVGVGEVVAAVERVGVVGAELRLAQLQRRLDAARWPRRCGRRPGRPPRG